MNVVPSFPWSRLAFGISRISIRPKTSRWKQKRARGPGPSGQPEGHGRCIYVFNHMQTNHTVYSLKQGMNQHHALKQIPFLGKKSKPAKIRKDYWRLMAMVEFPRDQCAVGLSVYQKLREFRARHELEWGSCAAELLRMGKRDRMAALQDQKANSVADLAAVLSGAGKGNKIWIQPPPAQRESPGQPQPVIGEEEAQPIESEVPGQPQPVVKEEVAKPAEVTSQGQLHPVTIYWTNDIDQSLAKQWSDNVQHCLSVRVEEPVMQDLGEVTEKTDQDPQARETDTGKDAA